MNRNRVVFLILIGLILWLLLRGAGVVGTVFSRDARTAGQGEASGTSVFGTDFSESEGDISGTSSFFQSTSSLSSLFTAAEQKSGCTGCCG